MVKNKNDDLKVDASKFRKEAQAKKAGGERESTEQVQTGHVADDKVNHQEENAQVAEMRKQINDLQLALQEQKNQSLYHEAEKKNILERAKRDVENAHRYGTEKLLSDLLPVLDSLELGLKECQSEEIAVKTLYDGIDLTHKMFLKVLAKFNVEQVNPVGEPFNAEFHQAISMKESEGDASMTVLEVLQRGYVLNGRIVRPALVVVAK